MLPLQSANGTVINKLKVVIKRQTCPLQTGDVIYLVYRKNEPEHSKRGVSWAGPTGEVWQGALQQLESIWEGIKASIS